MEVVTLRKVTAAAAQLVGLRSGLDAFGEHSEAKPVRETNDRVNESGVTRAREQALRAPVDRDHVDGELLEGHERQQWSVGCTDRRTAGLERFETGRGSGGVGRPKVVDDDVSAKMLEGFDTRTIAIDVGEQRALTHLECERTWLEVVRTLRVRELNNEIVGFEVRSGHVDRNR